MNKSIKTLLRYGMFIFMTVVLAVGMGSKASASVSEMDALGQKLNIARSDYLEAIASCNGALRKSAERQMDRILADIAAKKDRAKNDYETMSRNLSQIYQELAQHFEDPMAAKKFLDMAMGFVPVIGQAYGIADSIYEYADESVRADAGREVFNRAKKQIEEMEKVSQEYNQWQGLERDVQAQKASLARQFDKNCRGKDTDEWRYDTDGDVLQQSGQIDVELKGNDIPSGEVFQGTIQNNTGSKINVQFPNGAMFFPETPDTQRMIITLPPSILLGPGEQATVPFGGFCLDPQAFPPSLNTPENWFPGAPMVPINGSPFNQEFSQVPLVPGMVPGLFIDETLTPTGLPPQMEQETITQWTIWNVLEGFSVEDGEKKITEQVEEAGGTQTPEQIQELNENIWGNVNLVKKQIREDVDPIEPENTEDTCELLSGGNGTVDSNCKGRCSSEQICQAVEPAINTMEGPVICYVCQEKNAGPTIQEQIQTLEEGIKQREKALKKMPNNPDDSMNQAVRGDLQDSITRDQQKLDELRSQVFNAAEQPIFTDGFESGDTSAWSTEAP